jgi:hypothetical protein
MLLSGLFGRCVTGVVRVCLPCSCHGGPGALRQRHCLLPRGVGESKLGPLGHVHDGRCRCSHEHHGHHDTGPGLSRGALLRGRRAAGVSRRHLPGHHPSIQCLRLSQLHCRRVLSRGGCRSHPLWQRYSVLPHGFDPTFGGRPWILHGGSAWGSHRPCALWAWVVLPRGRPVLPLPRGLLWQHVWPDQRYLQRTLRRRRAVRQPIHGCSWGAVPHGVVLHSGPAVPLPRRHVQSLPGRVQRCLPVLAVPRGHLQPRPWLDRQRGLLGLPRP